MTVEEHRVCPSEETSGLVNDGQQRLLPQRFETREDVTPDKVLAEIGMGGEEARNLSKSIV